MKFLVRIACVAAFFYLQGCGDSMIKHKGDQEQASTAGKSKIPVPVATANLVIQNEKDLTGYWAGEFGPEIIPGDTVYEDEGDNEYDKINISIDDINGARVKGHTVIAGKARFFKCKMEKAGSKYQFMFKGAANEKGEGVFKFSIAEGDSLLKGSWDPGSDKIPTHNYALTKKLFSYNPNWKIDAGRYVDYRKSKKITEKIDTDTYISEKYATTSKELEKLNPSARLLTKDDIANLKKADLLVLRNSIFARHGYTFKKPALNLFFSQQSWYVPVNTDVTAELTTIEKKNIQLMMPYEKTAQEYYDAFGR